MQNKSNVSQAAEPYYNCKVEGEVSIDVCSSCFVSRMHKNVGGLFDSRPQCVFDNAKKIIKPQPEAVCAC